MASIATGAIANRIGKRADPAGLARLYAYSRNDDPVFSTIQFGEGDAVAFDEHHR